MFNLRNCFMIKKEEPIKPIKPIKPIDHIVLDKEFENNECIICLENMKTGDKIKILECGHIYHNECINDWFKRKKECPVCFK